MKYILYARKSSESEDRQIQSINDQINKLTQLANDFGIEIIKTYTEAKSAKKPGRPIFDKMIKEIQSGQADAILCWELNRLSRNPVDSGTISWMLQQEKLQKIQTIDRVYLPSDNVLLFNVETGMANQFLRDLSKNVKRGMQSKVERGWRPGTAPLGYKNKLSDHTMIVDKELFPLLRKAWDKMLTGSYSVPQILDILNNEWGFRTPKKKRIGGKPMSTSGLYRIFTNQFYAGIIKYNGQVYPGKHKTMITMEEYDKVQLILGRKGKPRPKKYKFSYTGMIRCSTCGCMVTAETKRKINKTNNKIREYTYYRCTRKKKHLRCKEPAIKLEELEEQIDYELSCITILPKFREWALECLNENNDKEIEDRNKIYESQHKAIEDTQKQLDNLTQMRYRDLIDDEEYIKERNKLQSEINNLKQKIQQTENRAENWIELTEKAFDFATYARIHFQDGNLDTKRDIVRTFGTEFVLSDKKLYIKQEKWMDVIKDTYPAIEKEYLRLEPIKFTSTKQKSEALKPLILRWHEWRESNPQ